MSGLAFEVRLDGPFESAIEKVGAALKEQGFGILTRLRGIPCALAWTRFRAKARSAGRKGNEPAVMPPSDM